MPQFVATLLSTDRPTQSDPKLVRFADLERIVLMLILLPFAWLASEQAWPAASRALAAITTRIAPGRTRWNTSFDTPELIPPPGKADSRTAHSRAAFARLEAGNFEDLMRLFRDYRPGGWRPEIRVTGREHLEAALRQGHGAILWISPSVGSTYVAKMAMHLERVPVMHLSRPAHGSSRTRFGMCFLNPVQQRVENRYIDERVVLTDGNRIAALRRLRNRLTENGVVSITVGSEGLGIMELALRGGYLQLPSGPVTLAHATGAALLPVFCSREVNDEFTVRIEAPITLTREANPEVSTHRVLVRYVELLDAYLERYGAQWFGASSWHRAPRCDSNARSPRAS